MNFYRGDITETFQEALRYYYIGKVLDQKDKKQLEELVKHVMYKTPESTQRISVPDSTQVTATPDTTGSLEGVSGLEALEIMGSENFYGPEDVMATFNINPDTVPHIPFSKADLERAKELGQELIFYVDRTDDGKPFTAKKMKEILGNKTSKGETFVAEDWFESDAVAKNEVPRMGWRLSAKDPFKESGSKNYLQQTQAIVDHLQKEVFPEGIPSPYQEAIDEFEAIKDSLAGSTVSDDSKEWKQAAETLTNLKINQMCRENYAEVLYRLALHEKKNKERLLDSPRGDIYYILTNSRGSDGLFVYVGDFDSGGAGVSRWRPGGSNSGMGVCFSRSE
jgi:hypothetical protein